MEHLNIFVTSMLDSLEKVARSDEDKERSRAVRKFTTTAGMLAGGYMGHQRGQAQFAANKATWRADRAASAARTTRTHVEREKPFLGSAQGAVERGRLALTKPRQHSVFGQKFSMRPTLGGAIGGALAGNLLGRAIS
jgi:hypothetical protein